MVCGATGGESMASTVAAFGTSMRIQIQLRIVADDNRVISESEILQFDKGDDRLEVIGLSFDEAKAALIGIQGGVVTAQAASFLARHRICNLCGSLLLSKGPGRDQFVPAFGTHRASQSALPLLSLPARSGQDLQPVEPAPDRAHRSGTALPGDPLGLAGVLRHDRGFAEGRFRRSAAPLTPRLSVVTCTRSPPAMKLTSAASSWVGLTAGNGQLLPQETVIVGIDGGYVRNWHDKRHNFEVVVGKCMATDRDDRYFGLVRSQDEQPGRRFREVLRSQGLPITQPVTMLTDGGDSVAPWQGNSRQAP